VTGPRRIPSFWFRRFIRSCDIEEGSLEDKVEKVLETVEQMLAEASGREGSAILGVFYIETPNGLYEARLWVFSDATSCACNFNQSFNPLQVRRVHCQVYEVPEEAARADVEAAAREKAVVAWLGRSMEEIRWTMEERIRSKVPGFRSARETPVIGGGGLMGQAFCIIGLAALSVYGGRPIEDKPENVLSREGVALFELSDGRACVSLGSGGCRYYIVVERHGSARTRCANEWSEVEEIIKSLGGRLVIPRKL